MNCVDSKKNTLKVGNKLIDRWYSRSDYRSSWGIGVIKKITKNRVHVLFKDTLDSSYKNAVYDYAHIKEFTLKYDKRLKAIKNLDFQIN